MWLVTNEKEIIYDYQPFSPPAHNWIFGSILTLLFDWVHWSLTMGTPSFWSLSTLTLLRSKFLWEILFLFLVVLPQPATVALQKKTEFSRHIFSNAWIMSFGQAVKCWNWRRFLKCLFTFLVFCWIEKKNKLLCNFCKEITQPFLDLENAPKCQH